LSALSWDSQFALFSLPLDVRGGIGDERTYKRNQPLHFLFAPGERVDIFSASSECGPVNTIPYGFCQCGCGEKTNLFRGQYNRFVKGHQWGNKGKTEDRGYIKIFNLQHPRANAAGYVYEHILIMEKDLGRTISISEHIHHIDGNPKNNKIGNLMLFATNSMHIVFHYRLKAFEKCGHYEWRRCVYCHKWDDPQNMVNNGAKSICHSECRRKYHRDRYPIRYERDKLNRGKP
jgi:hypothetical protein